MKGKWQSIFRGAQPPQPPRPGWRKGGVRRKAWKGAVDKQQLILRDEDGGSRGQYCPEPWARRPYAVYHGLVEEPEQ